LLLALLISTSGIAESNNIIRVGLLHGDPDLFRLPIAVLNKAFQHLEPPAELKLVDISGMNQKRALENMHTGNASFDIFFTGFSHEREQRLLQIDVPLTMGLLGSRVLVINKNRAEALTQSVKSTDSIKHLRIGSGIQWPDTEILIHNKFNVIQASYQGLWQMLENNRIDAFARGIEESFIEIEQRNDRDPAPVILDTWLLVYPLDYFVYLSPNKKQLYQQLNKALQEANNSGEIAAVIAAQPSAQKALSWLRNKSYTKIYLENPLLSDRIRQIPERYWLPEIRN